MNKLISSVSPHITSPRTTQRIMLDVLIALLPAGIASVIIFGIRSLLVIGVCVAVCVISEWAFEKICKKESTISFRQLLQAFCLRIIFLYQYRCGRRLSEVCLQ